jgi:hypothetical protein
MKKIFFTLLTIIIGFIAIFFLNSDFRNLIINIGASTSKEEILHQLGKNAPPLIHINQRVTTLNHTVIPSYKINNEKIINYYVLMISNTNSKDCFYKLKINNKNFSHSLQEKIHVASHKTKKINFQIYLPLKLDTSNRKIQELEITVIDENHPNLMSKEHIGFILKSI